MPRIDSPQPDAAPRVATTAPVVWLTGLSGAGKTTVATLVAAGLAERDIACEVLDGDEMRANLTPELGFSREDRERNGLRLAYVAHLLARHGVVVLAPVISPYRDTRARARELIGPGAFLEIHIRASLDTLERRDTKGLYAQARAGEIDRLTGVSDPYEPPLDPDLTLDTDTEPPDRSAERLLELVCTRLDPEDTLS